jgi:hypothetical protein
LGRHALWTSIFRRANPEARCIEPPVDLHDRPPMVSVEVASGNRVAAPSQTKHAYENSPATTGPMSHAGPIVASSVRTSHCLYRKNELTMHPSSRGHLDSRRASPRGAWAGRCARTSEGDGLRRVPSRSRGKTRAMPPGLLMRRGPVAPRPSHGIRPSSAARVTGRGRFQTGRSRPPIIGAS